MKTENSSDIFGFTLIEIIVSTTILVVLATGVFSTVIYSKRASLRTQDKAAAVSFLESKLDEYRQKGAKNIASEPAVCQPMVECDNDCCLDAPGFLTHGKFNTKVTASADPGFKSVKVTVWWDDRLNALQPDGSSVPARRHASIVTDLFQE